MPETSPFRIEIPATDLLSFHFPPAKEPSDKPIWIDAEDTTRSLSPKQLLQWVKRLGLALDRLGLRKGDVVMMLSTNHIFIPVFYMGTAGSGRVFTGCNPAYGVDEITYQIENTGAKAVFVEPPLFPNLEKACKKTGFPSNRVFFFSDTTCPPGPLVSGARDWRSILPTVEEASTWRWPRLDAAASSKTIAVLNYSSGTTGLPKGVCTTHQNIIANTLQSIHMRNLPGSHSSSSQRQGEEERWLGFLPLYHAYGQLWTLNCALTTHSPVYFMRTFSYTSFLQYVQTHRITHIQTAPPVLVMLAKRPETKDYDLRSLRNVLCGAAPLSKELQNEVSDLRIKNAHPEFRIVQTWGMTEVTCSALHVPGLLDDRSGSVGHIDPNCAIKLIDDDGHEVGPGERGEILVKGPNICMGYWKNKKATKDTFDEDGYLRTGDIAVRDKKGWYWIVDRKKELIKVKAFQVAPAELEALLLEHPSVADAAVVGVQLEHEERPRAYIAMQHGSRESEEEVRGWLDKRVAGHKRLTGGVVFIDEVPKSPSGKIQRKVLREWAREAAEEIGRIKPKL